MTTDKVKRAGNRSTKRRPAVRVFLGGAKARRDAVSRADGQFATHPAPFTNDHWRAWVLSNYDGDTMTVCYDAGFFDTGTRDVRLFGINAPELKTGSKRSRAKGQKAKALLAAMCPSGTPIAMVTSLDPNLDDPTEKYGRVLAQIVKYNPDGSTTDVNAAMLASGLVVSYLPGKGGIAGGSAEFRLAVREAGAKRKR